MLPLSPGTNFEGASKMRKGIILKILLCLAIVGGSWFLLGALIESVADVRDNPEISSTAKGLASVLPLVAVMAVIISIISVWYVPKVVEHFKWSSFGRRMKRAYAAKFGGENSAFNTDLDYRIKVMRTQGDGHTWTLAEDWLRRMAKFVEIPWKDISDEASQEDESLEDVRL